MAETDKHGKLMVDFIQMLEHYYSWKGGSNKWRIAILP